MEETKRKKHVREPPSIPFIWELKPGIPKKDWKPEFPSVSVNQVPITPLKLIASVPFVWEEKPGIPLPSFSPFSLESVPPKPDAELIHIASSSGYSVACKESSASDSVCEDGGYIDDSESITCTDLEAFSFETDESFGSVPSLLANCLVPSTKVPSAIRLQKNLLSEHNCYQLETPFSPASSDTESSTSSYATGMSSPIGASFLECLFPLYPPKPGFLEGGGYSENASSTPLELKANDFHHEDNNTSDMVQRPPTLGELIMMSRRRSYRRKAVHMRRWVPPSGIRRKQAFGCFAFATSSNMIEELLKRKYFPRLKTGLGSKIEGKLK